MKQEILTVNDYSATLDANGKAALEEIRMLASKLIPNCEERMSYGMPGFAGDGIIFWFAVWKSHYGFYPKAKALVVFADKLKPYKTSKGCVQFPADKALPTKLISDLIKYRLKENAEEKAAKKKTTKSTGKKTSAVAEKKVRSKKK